MLRQTLTGNLGGFGCNDRVMTIASKSSGHGGMAGGGSGGGSCCCAVALHFAFAPLKSSIASKKAWHRMQSSRGGSPCTGHEAGRVGKAATEGTSFGAIGRGRSGCSCSCDGADDITMARLPARHVGGASRNRMAGTVRVACSWIGIRALASRFWERGLVYLFLWSIVTCARNQLS